MVSVDGYFEGENADISWHNVDAAFNDFAIEQLHSIDTILFGRKTYQLMVSYWPTDAAKNNDPAVTELMNNTEKIVFSKTLKEVEWNNTKLIKDNIPEEILKLKQQAGKDIIVFGSANLLSALINLDVVDEFRMMINPLILGKGNSLFQNINDTIKLGLVKATPFKSGNVLLYYKKI
jgi:dihydrofolate reductase